MQKTFRVMVFKKILWAMMFKMILWAMMLKMILSAMMLKMGHDARDDSLAFMWPAPGPPVQC